MLRTVVAGLVVAAMLVVHSAPVAWGMNGQQGQGEPKGQFAAEAKKANHEGQSPEGKKRKGKKRAKKASGAASEASDVSKDRGRQLKSDMPVNLVPGNADHHGRPAPVDKREQHQGKRIEQGIRKGALTAQEQAELARQRDAILAKEKTFRSDGKLSQSERQQLQSLLNDSSRMIWAEKHDTEGQQLAVHAFGKNVFAKEDLLKKVSDPNLSASDARAIFQDYRTMLEDRRKLSEGNLSGPERARLQSEYNDLLNRYFEVR